VNTRPGLVPRKWRYRKLRFPKSLCLPQIPSGQEAAGAYLLARTATLGLRVARSGDEVRQLAVWQRRLRVPAAARARVPVCSWASERCVLDLSFAFLRRCGEMPHYFAGCLPDRSRVGGGWGVKISTAGRRRPCGSRAHVRPRFQKLLFFNHLTLV
jgi:hypothetical protein